ncbi:hypothetical protein BSF41_15390 [Flavobacterium sp. ACN2]|uniref:hypothetical protein n=1 Tax=unclassified Flavobacterium TaxID=196869 RepID=UPI000BB375E7|nr:MULTISPECIES: hypothetical protein [unclassified Flavobacterium]MDY0986092.1 hypothetical protein [Flavobacterium sp. CFBP9031]PBI90834.1 hypothetical protein BSF41_15390 [Flavobacterium sp. ACN2]
MITRKQIEELRFVYKQRLISGQLEFVNDEIKTMITLSLEGTVGVICRNYKKSWGNINSINEVEKIIESIKNKI